MNIKPNICVIACLAFSFQVHAFDFNKLLKDLSDASKEQAKSSATQEETSKPVVVTAQPQNITKSSSSSNVNKDTLVAFGIPLNKTFKENAVNKVLYRHSDNSQIMPNKRYDVVPINSNKYFSKYTVTLDMNKVVYKVGAQKHYTSQNDLNAVYEEVRNSLIKKYGKPLSEDKDLSNRRTTSSSAIPSRTRYSISDNDGIKSIYLKKSKRNLVIYYEVKSSSEQIINKSDAAVGL